MKDAITLNYKDNDELKAALGGKEPGDRCKITLDVLVSANSDEAFDGSIEGVELDESYEEKEETVSEEVDEDPVMEVISKKNAGRSKKDE
jgi:hypothetical protein